VPATFVPLASKGVSGHDEFRGFVHGWFVPLARLL